MLALIRTIRLANSTVIEQDDREFDGKQLALGSSPEQDIHLPGEDILEQHALLTGSGGKVKFRCKGKGRLLFDGKARSSATLQPGQSLTIGAHTIAVTAAPTGFDAALEVRIDTDAMEAGTREIARSIQPGLPPLRPWAWGLSFLVLLFGLLLPLAGFYEPQVKEQLNKYNVPHDSLWLSGPLTSAHRLPAIGDNCNVCHVKPFETVRNDTCQGCHVDTTEHFPAKHPDVGDFNDRCASCHREHNEPSTMVVSDEALCTECHVDALTRTVSPGKSKPRDKEILAVTGFAADTHPDFRYSLLMGSGDNWDIERHKRSEPGLRERSNLKFPHDLHLDPAKVTVESSGVGMTCNDCHSLKSDREHFQPITMEGSCRSCHGMEFDADDPSRQLPHAKPAVVQKHLQEFYVKKAAEEAGMPVAAPKRERRMPGRSAPRGNERCSGSVLDCGMEKAAEEMDILFQRSGCFTCHEVSRDSGEWRVQEVRITSDWYAEARFDHVPHLRLGPEQGASATTEVCLSCHSAVTSASSGDILIPGLDNCTECHGDNHAEASLVELDCVACHSFHRKGMDLMPVKKKQVAPSDGVGQQ